MITMNNETDLRKAIAYLLDLDAELDERSAVRGLRANSAARDDMVYQLDHARKLVAALERHASNISCISYHNGGEVLIDPHKARTWCHLVEAKIMRVCDWRECRGREVDEMRCVLFAACEGAGLLARTDLSSLRLVVLSGAAVPPDLVRTVEPRLHGGSLCQLWGMTELQAGLYTRLG